MKIIAIDPGTTESAYVEWDGVKAQARMFTNEELRRHLRIMPPDHGPLAIEMIASYGMPVGKETLETILWIGRFEEAFKGNTRLVYRKDIVRHHCHSNKGNDATVSQALRDKYGVKGTKKNPGFFFGFKDDMWQAFAIAAYVTETQVKPPANFRNEVGAVVEIKL